jgi:transcriptional regulator GlxA family with amidase domain
LASAHDGRDMPAPPGIRPVRHQGLLLLPGFSLLALASASEVLAIANEVLDDSLYQTRVLSLGGGAVRSLCGTRVLPDAALDSTHTAAEPLDLLLVVCDGAGPAAGEPEHALLIAALRALAARGTTLGGLGNGARFLAEAGLLAGHRTTVHWALVPPLAEAHADVVVSSNVYEIDRQRLASAGGTAALDLCIAWLAQRHGDKLAQGLMAHFGLERLRGRDERQRVPISGSAITSAKLTEALALMEANLAEPLPTEEVARLVGVSRRQLERLFKQHLDELPSRYYAELRLAKARRLLQQTPQSILQIALACGFASGSHFSNAYRARFGRTPRDERSPRAAAWRDQSIPTPGTAGEEPEA